MKNTLIYFLIPNLSIALSINLVCFLDVFSYEHLLVVMHSL